MRARWIAHGGAALGCGLICAWVALAASSPSADPRAARLLPLLGAVAAAPYLVAVALHRAGQRSRGLALLGTTAATAFLAVSPVVTLAVLLSGFANGGCQLAAIAAGALFALLQIPVLVAALRAHRALDAAEKRPGIWLSAFAAPVLCLVAIATLARLDRASVEDRRLADWRASEAVRSIARCAHAYATELPRRGFPPSLAEMGPGGTGCLDGALARGESEGHHIAYTAGLRDGGGKILVFDVCARPISPGRSGSDTVVADDSGALRAASPLREGAREAVACEAAWDDGLARAKHCLVRTAQDATPPSYPRDASAWAATIAPCAGTDAAAWGYHPGLPDGAGATRSFAVTGERNGAFFLLDEAGALHVARARGATRFDPTQTDLDDDACFRSGDVERCSARAATLENGALGPDAPRRAAQFYARACAAGDATSCRNAGALLLEPDVASPDQAMALLERACTLDDEDGCALLAGAKRSPTEAGP